MSFDTIVLILGSLISILALYYAIGVARVIYKRRSFLRTLDGVITKMEEETNDHSQVDEQFLKLSKSVKSIFQDVITVKRIIYPNFRGKEKEKVRGKAIELLDHLIGFGDSIIQLGKESERDSPRLKEIEESLDALKKERNEIDRATDEDGNATLEVLFFVVPAILAIAFTGFLGYLLIVNSGVQDYKAPEALTKPLMLLIGYYCGIGTSKLGK